MDVFAKLANSAMWSCHKQSPLLWLILNYEFYILSSIKLGEISVLLDHPLVLGANFQY
jgi:hypothetical protein